MNIIFTIEKQTPGAVRYMEVDEDGRPVKNGNQKIGTLYFRKTAFPSGQYPDPIKVTVEPTNYR